MRRAARPAVARVAIGAWIAVAACDRAPPPPSAWFRDRTLDTGIDFVHRHCGAGKKLIVEIVAGGVSLLDHDGDGDLDLFFPQGAPLPGFQAKGIDLRDRLFRNDGGFRFTDVTDATGATDEQYTTAAMCPDYDGDGDPDLFLCNVGRSTLLRNDGGRFVNVTDASGLGVGLWSTSAAFVNLDQDGDLDVYVCTYVLHGLAPKQCGDKSKGPEWHSYCNPDEYPPAPDLLFRNDGGRFVNVTKECLHGEALGSGLAVVPCDYDNDGDVDLFVSNDGLPNYLWRNDGALHLTEVGATAGVAVSGQGLSEACMGADFADIENDGDFDLLVANLAGETNTLYRNDGAGLFDDWSIGSGLGPPSHRYVGFGNAFFDADGDGDEDSLVVNGHVLDNAPLFNPTHTFAQPPLFMVNDGGGRFREVGPEEGGPWLGERRVARGLAIGDLDGDGDLDAVIAVSNGRPCILENVVGETRSWIAFRLRGGRQDRAAMGARVTIEAGGRRQMREVRGSSSFGAWQDLRAHFGLGALDRVERVRVRWPSGQVTEPGAFAAGRVHELREPGLAAGR